MSFASKRESIFSVGVRASYLSKLLVSALVLSLFPTVIAPGAHAAATTVPINSGSNPYGMASDSFGNTYVVNNGGNSVTKIKPDGSTQTISVGTVPFNVAIDSTGNAFVTNFGSASVTKIKPDGTTVTISAVGSNPYGITVDGSGNVYCTVGNGGSITKIANASTSDTPVVTTGWASTTATTGREMIYDGSGNIYAVGRGSGIVAKINVATAVVTPYTVVTGGSYAPYGIAIDPVSKNIYITIDFGTGGPGANAGSITKISPTGVVTLNWAATPSYPLSIAVDGSGNVYTANSGGTVTKVTPTGTVSTLLTIVSAGVALAGIAIDSQGNILVGDNGSGGAGAISKYIQPPAFTLSAITETGKPGTAIVGYTITNTSSFPDSYTVTPSVTNGLSFSTSTGLISGTPTAVDSVVTYTISGTNAAGTATATYSLTVSTTPVATTSSTPTATPAQVVCMVNQLTCHDAAELLGTLATLIGTTENGLNAVTKKVLQKKIKPKKVRKASK